MVERGTHEELIANRDGYYTAMWEKQAQATRAANRASLKLLKEASGHKQLELQSGYTSMASSAILSHPAPDRSPDRSPDRERHGARRGYDDHLTDGESSGTLHSDTDHR